LAASTQSKTWSSIEDALVAVRNLSLTGIGFVFDVKDPYVGIDLDNCRNPKTEVIADWAWEIIRALDSYAEVSPSGTGVHIISRGRLPGGKGRRIALSGGNIEMYSRGRYFTFTGNRIDGTSIEIRDRHIELLTLHQKLFGNRKPLEATTVSSQGSTSRNWRRRAHRKGSVSTQWSEV
jgi:primase-polymerase (primpol)-like protein